MLRPRRIYVGADLERLYADYLTHLVCRAAELGIPISPGELLFRNLDRPPLLSPLREGTVRDKVAALKRRRIGPADWTPHWFRHCRATALLISGSRNGWSHVVLATPTCRPLLTCMAGSARTKRFASPRTGRTIPMAGRSLLMHLDPLPPQSSSPATEHGSVGLLSDLPAEWRGEVIGPGIATWVRVTAESSTPLRLHGLPARIRTELAWMAHWQCGEGSKVTAPEYNQLAQMRRHCIAGSKLRIDSLLDVDPKVFVPLHRGWFESRYGRLPSPRATRICAALSTGIPGRRWQHG